MHSSTHSTPQVRMYTGNQNWVRRDDRHLLHDVVTCNVVVLTLDNVDTVQSILSIIRSLSATVLQTQVEAISYRHPELTARADAFHESNQQQRIATKGAALYLRLKNAKTDDERLHYQQLCSELYETNRNKWRLYLRATRRGRDNTNKPAEQYRIPCLSCGQLTFWHSSSGIRRDVLYSKCHHFCSKLIDFKSESFTRAPWLLQLFRERVTV